MEAISDSLGKARRQLSNWMALFARDEDISEMEQIERIKHKDRYLVAGLGNPGKSYRDNRHNIGFKVADALAKRHEIMMSRVEMRAIVGKGQILGCQVILAKPQTYMNESGQSVGRLLSYYDVLPANLLVIYDEIDLPLGVLRLREKGGSGGHNGMKSVISHVGNDFPRLRLGVGRPPGKMDPAAYVLRDFKGDNKVVAEDMVGAAVDAVESYLVDGIESAMNRYNGSLSGR